MAEKRNLTTKTTIDNLLGQIKSTFVKKTAFNTLNNKVNTLIGEDTNKSVRTIANEELAAQLIAPNADAALDTLQEIAAWIQQHPNDASAMNVAIQALEAKTVLGNQGYVAASGTYVAGTTYYTNNTGAEEVDTTSFEEGVTDVSSYFVAGAEYATVKAYVEAAIAALRIGDYAKALDLANLAARVDTLESIEPTKVEASTQNGYIKINNTQTTVYTLPSDVVKKTDIEAGTNNGQIKVQGDDVTVYTLPSEVVKTTDIGAYSAAKNGFISVQGSYTTVYVLPDDVLHESDVLDYSAAEIAMALADNTFALSNTSGSVAANSTITFTATVASTTTLTATTANSDIATVTPATAADGDNTIYTFTVTGVAEGMTAITVANNANAYDSEIFTVTVTA